MKLQPLDKDTIGLLQSRQFVCGFYVLAGFGGLIASWNLAIDRLILLSSPGAALNCDFSDEVSCGKVDQSWQASLLHLDNIPIPNAFIGMMAYSVLITVGVALFAGTQFPRWFNRAALGGQFVMLAFSYWLLAQSYFGLLVKLPMKDEPFDPTAYGALCPWCVMLMLSTTIMTFMLLHYGFVHDGYDKKAIKGQILGLPDTLQLKFSNFIKNYMWYLTLLAWVLLLIILLLVKYHRTLLGV